MGLKQQILDFQTEKEFSDNYFEFDENGKKFSKWVEKNCEKRRNCLLQAISPFLSVFKRLVLQTRKNQGLFGQELMHFQKVLAYLSLRSP